MYVTLHWLTLFCYIFSQLSTYDTEDHVDSLDEVLPRNSPLLRVFNIVFTAVIVAFLSVLYISVSVWLPRQLVQLLIYLVTDLLPPNRNVF